MALRLTLHHPELVAERIELDLFGHPLSRSAFRALAAAATLHDAIAEADPQTADLLQRLAVEEVDEDADDVMVRLVEVAGRRALADLQTEMRAAAPSDQGAYVASMNWLQLAVEALRTPDGSPVGRNADPDLAAERRLVAWIVERNEMALSDESDDGPVLR
jgi:hypothetical protein